MTAWLWLPFRLPGLNELVSAAMKGKGPYAKLKNSFDAAIGTLARMEHFKVDRAHFTYLFVERGTRRDRSNICGAGVKIIEDALTRCGAIPGDGWVHVRGFACFIWPGSTDGILIAAGDGYVSEMGMVERYLLGHTTSERTTQKARAHRNGLGNQGHGGSRAHSVKNQGRGSSSPGRAVRSKPVRGASAGRGRRHVW